MAVSKKIPRATAKDELVRLNETLNSPYLLVGGLAVQQYDLSRISKDIDIICDFETVQTILSKLYPTRDWLITDNTNDDYRPAYHIRHRHSENGDIFFGPKVSERGNYEFLDWEALADDALPFRYKQKELQNILIPQPHSLAYSKVVSFLGRNESQSDKIRQDLIDFCNLTNHKDFLLAKFWDLLNKYDRNGNLREKFRERSSRYLEIVKQSCLHALTELFSAPRYVTLEQLGTLEGSVPNLVRVMVVANRIEKPEGVLGQAVEDNFAKNVQYLFLISPSTAADEKKGYFKIFEAYQQIKSPSKHLLDIKALPFEWDDYPIIFYQYENDEKLASVAFRGSDIKKGITRFYERVPAEYAHTIAKSLLADAPKDIDQSAIPGRDEFVTGKTLNVDELKKQGKKRSLGKPKR